jgi:hypothetical protein
MKIYCKRGENADLIKAQKKRERFIFCLNQEKRAAGVTALF